MATLTVPSSFNTAYYRYSINGASWLANDGGYLYAGTTNSGNIYRAYFQVPGQSSLAGASISSITLEIPVGAQQSTGGKWDVGIMTSTPPVAVNYDTSGFTRIATNLSVTSAGQVLSVTIPVATWGDPTVTKYIVIVRSQQSTSDGSYSYRDIYCNSTSGRYMTLTYNYAADGVVRIYNSSTSSWDSYRPYIYNGSIWVQYAPYIYDSTTGTWEPCG